MVGKLETVFQPHEGELEGRRKSTSCRYAARAAILASLALIYVVYLLYPTGNGSTCWSGNAAETVFLTIPNEAQAINTSRSYSSRPHLAGSAQDLITAKDFLYRLQEELGISRPQVAPIFEAGSRESQEATLKITQAAEPRAWIDTYYPILSTPLEGRVQVLDQKGTLKLELDLSERPDDDTDSDAYEYADSVPSFHGLSRAGDVTGPVFDGGYCTKKEFDEFVERGASLKGTVVLCRYGWSFRGLKVKAAQELGALGVLIFNDVKDDGTVTEANGYVPYPHGPARNPRSVQRGGVQFVSLYPGDPTTPGYPSYGNATRTEGENIPSIPSLPLSWANAKQILRLTIPGDTLHGHHIRLVNKVKSQVTPIWNTLAVIPGHIEDEVVVIGNHRDAWVLGATDPISGTATLLEIVRGLGHLVKKGWKPLRTILIASWDAEEYGLIGSTEWGEDFTEWIDKHVVAYLNLDGAASGSRLRYSGSPLLSHLIRKAAEDLPHPTDKNRRLWDATKDDGKLFGVNASMSPQAMERQRFETNALDSVGVGPLGSGSDYTVFLQRIGVPSTNGGFSSTYHDPVYHYHSVFDTERWQELYGDPGFHRHIAVAKHIGLQALRISGSVVLPFNTTHYTIELSKYLERVEGLALQSSLNVSFATLRASIRSLHNASLLLDSEKKDVEAHAIRIMEKTKSPFLQLIRRIRDTYLSYMTSLSTPPQKSRGASFVLGWFGGKTASDSRNPLSGDVIQCLDRVKSVNRRLMAFERGFISKHGIKDREWFKHLGVAPGKWLGYGATTLPGLTEAITFEKNVTLVEFEAERLITLIDRLTSFISDPDRTALA